MKLTQAIDERIQYAQDQRPNAAQGLVDAVIPNPGSVTIYKIVGYTPGGREPFTCYSALPLSLSQGMSDLSIGTPVLVEIPQGAMESGKIVAVLDLMPEEKEQVNSTKDTTPTVAQTKAAPSSFIQNMMSSENNTSVLNTIVERGLATLRPPTKNGAQINLPGTK